MAAVGRVLTTFVAKNGCLREASVRKVLGAFRGEFLIIFFSYAGVDKPG